MDGFGQKRNAILLTRIVSCQNERMVELRKNEIFMESRGCSESSRIAGLEDNTQRADRLFSNHFGTPSGDCHTPFNPNLGLG